VKADLSKSDNNLENTGKSHLRPRARHGCHCADTNLRKLLVLRRLGIPNSTLIGQQIWKVRVHIHLRPYVKYGCH